MGQSLSRSSHRHLFIFIPHLFLTSVVAFSLSSHIRASFVNHKTRLPRVCATGVGAQLHNPNKHNVTAFEDSYSLYLNIMKENQNSDSSDSNIEQYKSALKVLTDALRIFGPESVIASYNGGKDAVAIMHLLRAALAAYSVEHGTLCRPKLVYFTHKREFPEVEALVFDTAHRYDLELIVFDCGFVEGLKKSVQDANGKPLAFVLGTREGDPNSGDQGIFAPSSDWMPPFMRVNPILPWSYGTVWSFLKDFALPYCSLYDEGYTSLGNLDNTAKNPALKTSSGDYLPASDLIDWNLERAGRVKALEADDVMHLVKEAVEASTNRLKSAKTALVVHMEESSKVWKGVGSSDYVGLLENRGISVQQATTTPVNLQAYIKSQCSMHDIIIVEADLSLRAELIVDTTSFGVQPPIVYENVLSLSSSLLLKLFEQIDDSTVSMVVVDASAEAVEKCLAGFLPKDKVSTTVYSGFNILREACVVKICSNHSNNEESVHALLSVLKNAALSAHSI